MVGVLARGARDRLRALHAQLAQAGHARACRPGSQLHFFAAPLAASTLNGDANLNPPCTLARHDPRALNVCLLVKRGPLVLDFFVTNSSECEREVDTMQALARRPALRRVQFAAVAVNGSHAATAKAVRRHGWTIPVAYDADGAVGGAVRRDRLPAARAGASGAGRWPSG